MGQVLYAAFTQIHLSNRKTGTYSDGSGGVEIFRAIENTELI